MAVLNKKPKNLGIADGIKKILDRNPRLLDMIYKRLHKSGVDIILGINPFTALITTYDINQVFDVGANKGQYAQRIRKLGYKEEIISFEPVQSSYAKLAENAAKDPLWTAVDMGCGDYDGEAEINISVNSLFSSILPQTSVLETEYISKLEYIKQETIKLCKIDTIFNRYYKAGKNVLLKIDTQGFEKKVLDGSRTSLQQIMAVQLELSFRTHYEGELLIKDMLDFMFAEGFTLVALEPLQKNLKRKKLLQGDGFFFRLDKI